MHPVGQSWVDDHGEHAEHGADQCRACHGADFRGTVLSLAQADRVLDADDFGTKTYFHGERVSCYGCHDGPHDEDPPSNLRPTALGGAFTVGSAPVTTTLLASDPDGDPLEYRIVRQPTFGRVGLAGDQATYIPDPGFAGLETFTWAAWDGAVDSPLATVTVTRLAGWTNYSYGYPGTSDSVPDLVSSAPPALGSTVQLGLANSSGGDATAALFLSLEAAQIDTKFGGVIVTEPTVAVWFTLPASGAQLPWSVSNDPLVTGVSLLLQTVQQDGGATFGYAFSRGLRLTLGP